MRKADISGLYRFFRDPSEGERVIGTYIYPVRLFGSPDFADASSATVVIRTITIGLHDILVTRMGGLFVRPPGTLSDCRGPSGPHRSRVDTAAKLQYEEDVAGAFNRIICELALLGTVSEPASPVHIAHGQLVDGHAVVGSAPGGREVYLERTLGPYLTLLADHLRFWFVHPEDVLDQAAVQARTTVLASISDSLPALVPGAYYYLSRRQPAEAVMDSWIVTEQILDYLWQTYVSALLDHDRRERLSDSRTYTASVRTEVLHMAGVIDTSLYNAIHKARKHRNDLAHRAKITLSAAIDCLTTMKAAIEFVCNTSVAEPDVGTSVNW